MRTEYGVIVIDYWKIPNENYNVKIKEDDGLDDDGCDLKIALLARLGAFILSNTTKTMNNFVSEINGFYNNNVFTLILIHCILRENIAMC